VIFPGGVGTAEETLYLLGILLSPRNDAERLPLVFTGPASSKHYFERLHVFIGETLGSKAQARYKIILADPGAVAAEVTRGIAEVRGSRAASDNAYFYNWNLHIDLDFQQPFEATHDSMAALELSRDQPTHDLAYNLRRAFSGIVAGNVREAGIRLVEKHGPFELRGDRKIIGALDRLLKDFVAQRRMRISDPTTYEPCYRIAV
jgi:pyrimidine/purine-5'-nucleotide nucleosidase